MRYTSFTHCGRGQRQGVVLLVVIAMLTLFSAMALSFVFYAESEAVVSDTASLALNKTAPGADPELVLTHFLSQLIYGTNNPSSAIRGYDLGRTMYGSNP